MADTKVTALTELSVPALEDLAYVIDDPGGTPASMKVTLARLLGLARVSPQGRLTTESGVAVSTSDRTAQGTIYYTPFVGNIIHLFDGTRWHAHSFAEVSLALTVTSGSNYDVFLYNNAGTLTLELSAAWTNDTTPSDTLAFQDGVAVKSGATTRRWLGTIRASGSNVTADSGGGGTSQVGGKRFVWNAYNQVQRLLKVIDTTDNWNYATGTWRYMNGASGNKVEWVCGRDHQAVALRLMNSVYTRNQSGRISATAVGIDWSSGAPTTGFRQAAFNAASTGIYVALGAEYIGAPGTGYHFASALEYGADGDVTWVGDNAGDGQQTGLHGLVWC